MFQHLKKYFTIRSYVKRLSQELVRRFGRKPYYSVEHVTQAAQRDGFSMVFIAYAHAAFCSQVEFDAHYKRLGVSWDYQELRRTIARRYLSRQSDFDAQTIFNRFRSVDPNREEFYESGKGEDAGGHGH